MNEKTINEYRSLAHLVQSFPKASSEREVRDLCRGVHSLADALGALQAKLDRVMLEHCPDEMSEEQKANWARHQKAVPDPDDEFLVREG